MVCSRLLRSTIVVTICMLTTTLFADENADRARAALAIAKAAREREYSSAQTKEVGKDAGVMEGCFTDLSTARKVSKVLKKPLVLWVGMVCTDAPDTCKSLADDVVSCHLTEYHGDKSPRIVVSDPDGVEYKIRKQDIDATTPIGVRKRMGLPVPSTLIEQYRKKLTEEFTATRGQETPMVQYLPSYMPTYFPGVSSSGTVCST